MPASAPSTAAPICSVVAGGVRRSRIRSALRYGTADHFVLTVQDVTARHQVQEQLERTEAHLRHGQQIARLASYEVFLHKYLRFRLS